MKAASCATTEFVDSFETPGTSDSTRSNLQLPLISLDVGSKRIGVAVSDRLGLGARGIACLQRRDTGWPKQLLKLVAEYGCRGFVIGLPKNMDGSEGPQAEDCRSAAAELATACELPQVMWDERLTTWTAKERLREQGLNEKKVAEKVDQTAAAIILEDFLAAHPELKP